MTIIDKLIAWFRMLYFKNWIIRGLTPVEFNVACHDEVQRVRDRLRQAPASREMYRALAVLDELDKVIEEHTK